MPPVHLMPKRFVTLLVIIAMKIPEIYIIMGIIATYVAGNPNDTLRYNGIYA